MDFWQRGFGADPQIIGRTLQVNGRAVTVVGVLPKGFDYPSQTEMWQPLAFTPADLGLARRGQHGIEVVARLKARGFSLRTGAARTCVLSRGQSFQTLPITPMGDSITASSWFLC